MHSFKRDTWGQVNGNPGDRGNSGLEQFREITEDSLGQAMKIKDRKAK
jgi:hypothetical protein